MKRNLLSIRAAILALSALGALALPTLSAAATSFTFNGVPTCNDIDGSMTMTPSGGLAITCTVVTAGPAATAPVCTATATSPITAGGQSTVSASCNPPATLGYSWTPSVNNPPTMSGQSQTLTFPNAGSYTYQVVGTNAVGSSALSAAATVLVNAVVAGGGGGGGSCTTTAVNGQFVGHYTQFQPVIPRGTNVSFAMPVYSTPAAYIMLSTAPGGSYAVPYLWTELALSSCPGDFNVPAECHANGIADSMTMTLTTGAASTPGGKCTLVMGQQYYLNVRNVYSDRTTPSCNASGGNCSLIVQLNSN